MSEDLSAPKLPEPLATTLAQRIAAGALELPVLPDVATQIVSQTSNPNCDFKKVAELIHRDQAMATHLLRIANSPLYRPRTQIVSLQHALSRLGTSAVRDIALIISVKTRTFQADGFAQEVKEMFRHSLATAVFAQEIARTRRWNVDEAFLCGLLHDIGRPVLLQKIVDLAKQLRLAPEKPAVSGAATEHHASVGSVLVKKWALPDSIATTILRHHETSEQGARTVLVTSLADRLAHGILSEKPEGDDGVRSHFALNALNLYPEDVDKLLAMRERVLEIVASLA
jgi:putative nucleotidyltransferase with HDIG domain